MMRKKITALACALALSVSLLPSALAVQSSADAVLPTLAAMGVMNGDENGDLRLEENVTRAAFIKMAVAASSYKDMAASVSHVSPFADVKYTHWAAGYVKCGVEAGWINGYLDGTFRPDNSVKLEEAVNICLKMLGYTDADFSGGTFPYPQLALYENLKMNQGISAKRGEELTRQECAQLIYNTLNATAKSGAVYAAMLGYALDASGDLDYLSVLNAEMEGPVLVQSDTWTAQLGFTPVTVYRNDKESTAAAVQNYDVVYYLKNTKTVWAYHNHVTGIYESALPSRSNPTSVTVSGVNYTFETSSAAHAVSTTGTFQPGDAVTLVLGRDNAVAAVIDSAASTAVLRGVVLGTGTGSYTDAQGKIYTATYLKMLSMDGATYEYQTEKANYYKEGDLIKVTFDQGEAQFSRLTTSSKNLSGKVNSAATKLGSYTFADDVKIMDYADETAITISTQRLAGVKIETDDVVYYELNGSDEIEVLILKNFTGDLYSFGMLTDATEIMSMDSKGNIYAAGCSYTIQSGSKTVGPLVCQNTIFPVSEGNAVRYRMDGTALDKLYNLTSVKLSSVDSNIAVTVDRQKFDLSNGVQVYRKEFRSGEGTKYFLTNLDTISSGEYTLTGWYDKLESRGGRMRIIVATAK